MGYEDRWKATEVGAKEKLNNKMRQAYDDRRKMEEQLAKLDEEREREGVASREFVEEQKQVMFEARQSALSEMEAKLAARKKYMSEQVDAERRRCEVVRRRELRKAEDN